MDDDESEVIDDEEIEGMLAKNEFMFMWVMLVMVVDDVQAVVIHN